jgi:hypothetical protein
MWEEKRSLGKSKRRNRAHKYTPTLADDVGVGIVWI